MSERRSASVVLWIFCERCHVAHEAARPPVGASDAVFRVEDSNVVRPIPMVTCPRCGSCDVWLRWAADGS